MIGIASRVAQIAPGEAEEEFEANPEKNEAAAALGRKAVRQCLSDGQGSCESGFSTE